MGRGNAPQGGDSLVLEFKRPSVSSWTHIWSKAGYKPTPVDTGFHLVMIPVKDTAYLKDGFQFRFRNYATVSGNFDHWHVDYVYLNKFRSINDTIFDDITFVYPAPSMLVNYTAMPWKQYQVSELKKNFFMLFRNNNNLPKKTIYRDSIVNVKTKVTLCSYFGGEDNLVPFSTSGYGNYASFSNPPVNCVLPTFTDSTAYEMLHLINYIGNEKVRQNDTLRGYQEFYNYYAYDDGSAEKTYALNRAFAQLAYKFSLNQPDTLVAVKMFFTPLLKDVSELSTSPAPFKITVWADDGGKPGTILYQSDTVVYPVYERSIGKFTVFPIKQKQLLLNTGAFYVGWTQITTELMNVGYDVNTNARDKIFYNTDGTWQPTAATTPGSLMIRPVLGSRDFLYIGLDEKEKEKKAIRLYPNPAREELTVDFLGFEVQKITIVEITGKEVRSLNAVQNNVRLDISDLKDGIYFVVAEDAEHRRIMEKLVIIH